VSAGAAQAVLAQIGQISGAYRSTSVPRRAVAVPGARVTGSATTQEPRPLAGAIGEARVPDRGLFLVLIRR
jgi:hypothetical protein